MCVYILYIYTYIYIYIYIYAIFILIQRKLSFETNSSFWPVETDFLTSGNHFVPISQIYLPLKAVIPSPGNISFITASGNGFSVYWK